MRNKIFEGYSSVLLNISKLVCFVWLLFSKSYKEQRRIRLEKKRSILMKRKQIRQLRFQCNSNYGMNEE